MNEDPDVPQVEVLPSERRLALAGCFSTAQSKESCWSSLVWYERMAAARSWKTESSMGLWNKFEGRTVVWF